MSDFVKVCKFDDLKEKQGKRFFVNDTEIAIFLVNGKVHALNNICPHQHAAIIYDGFIEDGKVMCPVHGWEFDLETGKLGGTRKGLDCYEVKLENDDVLVKVTEKNWNW